MSRPDWAGRLSQPVEVEKGRKLRTLHDVRDYLLALPPTRQANPANAALTGHLLAAAEDRGDVPDVEVALFFSRRRTA
jgi:hypothetical protein